MKPAEHIVLTVRLERAEHEALKNLAIANRRSVSQQVRRWIEEAQATEEAAA